MRPPNDNQATSVHKSYPRSLGWASTLQLNSLKVKTKFGGEIWLCFLQNRVAIEIM